MIIRELIAKFGIQWDGRGAAQAQTQVAALKAGFSSVHALLGGIGVGIAVHWLHTQFEIGEALEDNAKALGITTQELQAFQFAGERSGVAAEQMSTGLRFLQKNLGDLQQGAGTAKDALAAIGVTFARGEPIDTREAFTRIAEGFANTENQALKTSAAMRIFGRSGAAMIPLLNEGAEGVDELFRRFEALGGGMSEDFVEQAGEVEDRLLDLDLATTSLKSNLILGIVPTILEAIKRFTAFAVAVRKVEDETGAITAGLKVLGTVAAVAAAIFIAQWLAAAAPFILIAAGIFAIVLLIQDFITFLQGGESLTGEFFDAIGWGADHVRERLLRLGEFPAFFAEVWGEALGFIGERLSSFGEFFVTFWTEAGATVGKFVDRAVAFGDFFMTFWSETIPDSIKAAFTALVNGLKQLLSPRALGMSGGAAGSLWDSVTSLFGSRGAGLSGIMGAAGAVTAPGSVPVRPGTSNETNTATTVNNSVTVAVQAGGGASARDAGEASRRGVEEALRQVNREAERSLTRVATP